MFVRYIYICRFVAAGNTWLDCGNLWKVIAFVYCYSYKRKSRRLSHFGYIYFIYTSTSYHVFFKLFIKYSQSDHHWKMISKAKLDTFLLFLDSRGKINLKLITFHHYITVSEMLIILFSPFPRYQTKNRFIKFYWSSNGERKKFPRQASRDRTLFLRVYNSRRIIPTITGRIIAAAVRNVQV